MFQGYHAWVPVQVNLSTPYQFRVTTILQDGITGPSQESAWTTTFSRKNGSILYDSLFVWKVFIQALVIEEKKEEEKNVFPFSRWIGAWLVSKYKLQFTIHNTT